MTIEEMIVVIQSRMGTHEAKSKIIAALRAGQEMRHDADLSCPYMAEACGAWDAATAKGEKG